MNKDVDALLKAIANRLDPDELVDVLGLSTEELVELLKNEILKQSWKFEEFDDAY